MLDNSRTAKNGRKCLLRSPSFTWLHSRISLRTSTLLIRYQFLYWRFWQEKTYQYRFCKSNNPSLLPLLVSKFTLRFDQVYQTSYMSHPLLQQQQQLLLWQQHDTCSWTRSCQTHNFRHPNWTLRGFRLPNLFYKFKIILPHDFIRNLEEWTFGPSIHLYGSRQIGLGKLGPSLIWRQIGSCSFWCPGKSSQYSKIQLLTSIIVECKSV